MFFKVYMLGQFKQQVNDDGQITTIRIGDWKVVCKEQPAKGMMVWNESYVELRSPKLFNPWQDTFERAGESSNTYWDWALDHLPALYAAQELTTQQLQSFVEFLPRQKPVSFNLDSLMEKMRQATDGNLH